MKLTVKHLGRIDQAQFDIRPLTVFIGENGTNKTWVAYSLYGFIRPRAGLDRIPDIGLDQRPAGSERFSRIAQDNSRISQSLVDAAGTKISIERDFAQYFPDGSSEVRLVGRDLFLSQLLRLPSSPQNVDITLEFDRFKFPHENKAIKIQTSPHGNIVTITSSSTTFSELVDPPSQLRSVDYWLLILDKAFDEWFMPQLNPFVLPAERKALSSAYDLLRDEFTKAVSLPVADYAEFLRSSHTLLAHGRSLGTSSACSDLATLLETQVVKGAIGFAADRGEPRLLFKPSAQIELPIHAASSLVRALAGLDLYLQTKARPGDFLFIDEVEMNAHPEAQLALVELLAILVNRGIYVVMTSHSPYVIEHLNNLMAAAQVPADRGDELIPLFQLKSREAFLSPDKVAAYGFTPTGEKVTVSDILDRESGTIDWRTFSRITDQLSEVYGRIQEVKERS